MPGAGAVSTHLPPRIKSFKNEVGGRKILKKKKKSINCISWALQGYFPACFLGGEAVILLPGCAAERGCSKGRAEMDAPGGAWSSPRPRAKLFSPWGISHPAARRAGLGLDLHTGVCVCVQSSAPAPAGLRGLSPSHVRCEGDTRAVTQSSAKALKKTKKV